jgi:hypothetical protein
MVLEERACRCASTATRAEYALRLRILWPQAACLIGGTVIGAAFGDKIFPEIEAMFGDPVTDIFFGLLGAFFAAIVFEAVQMFLRPD